MAPNDHLRAGAVLLNAVAELAVDAEHQFRDGGLDHMQAQARALQAHAAQLAARVNAEIEQTNGGGQ